MNNSTHTHHKCHQYAATQFAKTELVYVGLLSSVASGHNLDVFLIENCVSTLCVE